MRRMFVATLAIATLSCNSPQECPVPPTDYTAQKDALVNLFDSSRDGCVKEVDDLSARDAIVAARGASGFNAWRSALDLCL